MGAARKLEQIEAAILPTQNRWIKYIVRTVIGLGLAWCLTVGGLAVYYFSTWYSSPERAESQKKYDSGEYPKDIWYYVL
jgi:hypothetical protein